MNCIIWKGTKWSQGRYGKDEIDGKSMGAHRAAWIRAKGAIPNGLVVCHKCDNGLCVNVDHLFLGTPKDNMQDCLHKGRLKDTLKDQRGVNNNNARPDYLIIKHEVKRLRALRLTFTEIKLRLKIKSNGHLVQLLKA